jgi:hypothetical protein
MDSSSAACDYAQGADTLYTMIVRLAVFHCADMQDLCDRDFLDDIDVRRKKRQRRTIHSWQDVLDAHKSMQGPDCMMPSIIVLVGRAIDE